MGVEAPPVAREVFKVGLILFDGGVPETRDFAGDSLSVSTT